MKNNLFTKKARLDNSSRPSTMDPKKKKKKKEGLLQVRESKGCDSVSSLKKCNSKSNKMAKPLENSGAGVKFLN